MFSSAPAALMVISWLPEESSTTCHRVCMHKRVRLSHTHTHAYTGGERKSTEHFLVVRAQGCLTLLTRTHARCWKIFRITSQVEHTKSCVEWLLPCLCHCVCMYVCMHVHAPSEEWLLISRNLSVWSWTWSGNALHRTPLPANSSKKITCQSNLRLNFGIAETVHVQCNQRSCVCVFVANNQQIHLCCEQSANTSLLRTISK